MNRPDGKPVRHVRGQLVIALPAVVLVLLVGRLIHIQTRLRPELLEYTQQQREAHRLLRARRGTILDRNGRVLAASREGFGVFADPAQISDPDSTAAELARILGLDRAELLGRLTKDRTRRFVWVQRDAEEIDVDQVRKLRFAGVGIQTEPRRVYPLRETLCHVLGFVGREHRGLEGIELKFDEALAGKDGKRTLLVDARRRAVWSPPLEQVAPKDGHSLVLTVDVAIQQLVERTLEKTVAKFEAESAIGLVTDPRTGEILAMASWPPFDPNEPGASPTARRRNRAVTDPSEPGSAFKIFPASAYLNEGLTDPDEVIFCHNGLAVLKGRRIRDAHKFGNLTMSEVVARSSNIGMVILMQRMTPPKLFEYLTRFGFGQKTGIDLPGESAGLLPPTRKWSSYSPGSMSFGQEIAVTPLQLITAMGAVVNRGRMMRPFMIKSILDSEGREVRTTEPVFEGQAVRADVADVMTRRILVQTVTEGSGEKANLPDYHVLGKTGTAQVPYKDRPGYEPGVYLSSFVAAAPATDPRICVLVQIRRPNPRISYYARVVAVPAVAEILSWTLPYLGVPPDKSPQQLLAHSEFLPHRTH